MAPNLILHLHDLELALRRHAFLELSVAEATALRKAFLRFKDRLLTGVLPQEPGTMPPSHILEGFADICPQTSGFRNTAEKALNASSKTELKKKQILLAEHDAKVAAFFIKHLQKAGYEVLWSSYTSMAKTLIHNGTPDLVLCSVYSRRSFGREVLTYLRNLNSNHIPAILIGGAKHSEALADAIALGADDYLAQHITAAEVIGKIKRLLNE